MWPLIAGLAVEAGSALLGASSAGRANATNIKLSREQRAWETQMSNTAVQRRADDIRMAGGNPALAFTGGQSASTPSVAAPTVEPTFRPEWTKGSVGQAMMMKAQVDNLITNTALNAEKARQEKAIADAMTRSGPGGKGTMAQWAYDTKNLHSALKYDTDAIRKDMTAAQLKQFTEASDSVVQTIKQQAERGQIDLDQVKSVIQSFGLGAQAKATLIESAMRILLKIMTVKD